VALADAVRESRDGVVVGSAALNHYGDPAHAAHVGAAPPAHQPAGFGRRRGHLRVLPDPPE
jgi:hypothetical protein